jgi:hypothetical protein
MANPSSARLSRSTSDVSGVNQRSGTSSRVDGGKDTLPRAKIQALEQFIMFGRKGKQKDKDKSNQKAAEFPPPAWFDPTSSSTTSASPATANTDPNTAPRAVPRRDNASTLPPPRAPPQHPSRTGFTTGLEPPRSSSPIAQDTSRRVSTDVPSAAAAPSGAPTLQRRGSSFPNTESLDGGDVTPPEPLTLAKRIQALLSPQTASTPSATDATTSSGAAQSETAGPATPGGSIPPGDSRFLALLGNPSVMSGSLDKGRQSVFAILDRLRRPSAPGTEAPAGAASSSTPGEDHDNDDREGDGSVMLYAPLVPNEDSEVELAASDITSTFDDGETLEYEQPARPLSFAQAGEQHTPRSASHTLPSEIPGRSAQDEGPADASQSDTRKEPGNAGWFDTLKGKVLEGGKLVSGKVTEGTKSLKGNAGEGRKVVQTKTRWVPSPDKISFQATWWGYRLYVFIPIFTCKNWIDLVRVSGICLRLFWTC